MLAFAVSLVLAILPLVEGCGWLEGRSMSWERWKLLNGKWRNGEAPVVVFGFFEFGGSGDRVPYERDFVSCLF